MQSITNEQVKLLKQLDEQMYGPETINSKLSLATGIAGFVLLFPTILFIVNALPTNVAFRWYYSVSFLLFSVQLCAIFFFQNIKRAQAYHGIHISVFLWVYIKFTVDAYLFFYIFVFVEHVQIGPVYIGAIIQILGVVLLVRLTKRSTQLTEKENRNNGNKDLVFTYDSFSLVFFILGGIVGVLMIICAFVLYLFVDIAEAKAFIPLGFCMTIQYLISLIIPKIYVFNKYKHYLVVK